MVATHLDIERQTQIRLLLAEYFSLEELNCLVFDLGVNIDAIAGESIDEKALQVVRYCDRRGLLDTLINLCQAQRPHAPWPVL